MPLNENMDCKKNYFHDELGLKNSHKPYERLAPEAGQMGKTWILHQI